MLSSKRDASDSNVIERSTCQSNRCQLAPSRTTVPLALRDNSINLRAASCKTLRSVIFPALDSALADWVRLFERLRLSIVTSETVREKGSKIKDELVAADPETAVALAALRFLTAGSGSS